MNISVIFTSKTDDKYIKEGISKYEQRISRYTNIGLKVINIRKKTHRLSGNELKKIESKFISEKISPNEYVILLDEGGKSLCSVKFAEFLNNKMVSGLKNITFIIGGACGVDESLKKRADFVFSMSAMTFSHQMIRLFLLEQIYRAFTILNNEPYHNN